MQVQFWMFWKRRERKMNSLILFISLLAVDGNTDQKCMPSKTYEDVIKILKQYQCLQETKPDVKLGELNIVIDEAGRIYSGPEDGNTDITGNINWCAFDIKFKFKPKIKMHTKKKPVGGFRFRFKAYVYAKFIYIKTPRDILDAGIGIDFLHYKRFNVQVVTGILSFGLGVGWDITKNFGAVLGVVNPWWEFRISPIAGFYFGF